MTTNDMFYYIIPAYIVGMYLFIFRKLIFERTERYRYGYNWRSGRQVRHNFCRNAYTGFIEYNLYEIVAGVDRFEKPVDALKDGHLPELTRKYYEPYFSQNHEDD